MDKPISEPVGLESAELSHDPGLDIAKLVEKTLLQPCHPEDVPSAARALLDEQQAVAGKGSFHRLEHGQFQIGLPDNSGKTYIETYGYGAERGSISSAEIHLVDIDPAGELIGHGIVVFFGPKDSEGARLFVRWTRTYHGHEGRGLGLQRLITMSEATKHIIGLPLASGSITPETTADTVARQWQKLEAAKVAVKKSHDPLEYQFVV